MLSPDLQTKITSESCVLVHHLSQHHLQDSAVAEVLHFDRAVYPDDRREGELAAVGATRAHGELGAGLERVGQADDVVRLGSVEAECLPRLTVLELERQD